MSTVLDLVQLKEVVRFHYGSALKATERNEGGLATVYGSNGPVGRHDERLVDSATIIVGRKGSVGSVYFAPNGGWPIDTTYYTEIIDPRRLHLRYLFYALKQSRLDQQAITTSIPGLNRETLYRTEILLPPLAEQKRIADILDKADAIRRQRQEADRLARLFLRASFSEMFEKQIRACREKSIPPGWASVTIDDLKSEEDYSCVGGPFGSDLTASDYVSVPGVPVIRGGNLSRDQPFVVDEDLVFVSEAKARDLWKCSAVRGDLIVSQRGARLAGQVGLIPEDSRFPRYIVSQSQMKLTVDHRKVDSVFLLHYFQFPCAVREMENRTISTGVPHINLSILKSFPIYLPPRKLQMAFKQLWIKHQSLVTSTSSLQIQCGKLFDSIVQRAFRGDL